MAEPTGKLAFAYRTIANLESQLEIAKGYQEKLTGQLNKLESRNLYLEAQNETMRWLLSIDSLEAEHPDDIAVAKFTLVMQEKLAKKREEGRGGWQDPKLCPPGTLNEMLCEHVAKGDPVDVANLAMMLHTRGERTSLIQRDAEVIHEFVKEVCQFAYMALDADEQDESGPALAVTVEALQYREKKRHQNVQLEIMAGELEEAQS